MAAETPHPPSSRAELVPRRSDRADGGVPRTWLLGTDIAVGAATRAARLALRFGETGWGASVAVGRVAAGVPGADGAGRLLGTLTRPLADEGLQARRRAGSALQAGTGRLLEALVPAVIDALDVEEVVRRIDIDQLVGRIDIDRLVRRIDIDQLVRRIEIDDLVRRIDIDQLVRRIEIDDLVGRIEIDELVRRIDIDRLVGRVDIGAIVDRVDVNEVVQRVDIDSVVEETELGTIVARSTSGFASEALDAARSQTAGVDTLLSRMVNRALRRKEGEMPVGPPLLTGEQDTGGAAPEAGAEPQEPQEPDLPGGTPR